MKEIDVAPVGSDAGSSSQASLAVSDLDFSRMALPPAPVAPMLLCSAMDATPCNVTLFDAEDNNGTFTTPTGRFCMHPPLAHHPSPTSPLSSPGSDTNAHWSAAASSVGFTPSPSPTDSASPPAPRTGSIAQLRHSMRRGRGRVQAPGPRSTVSRVDSVAPHKPASSYGRGGASSSRPQRGRNVNQPRASMDTARLCGPSSSPSQVPGSPTIGHIPSSLTLSEGAQSDGWRLRARRMDELRARKDAELSQYNTTVSERLHHHPELEAKLQARSHDKMKRNDARARFEAESGDGLPQSASERVRLYEAHAACIEGRMLVETRIHATRNGPRGSAWIPTAVYTSIDDEVYLLDENGIPYSLRHWIHEAHPDEELAYSSEAPAPVKLPSRTHRHEQSRAVSMTQPGHDLSEAQGETALVRRSAPSGFGFPVRWTDEQRDRYMDEMSSVQRFKLNLGSGTAASSCGLS